jgi:hypothetical protein
VTKYVACVDQHGFKLPAPNFTGTGPVFSSSQVSQSDPKFIAASKECASLLQFAPAAPAGAPAQ